MPLDVAILGADARPELQVSIDLGVHPELMERASALGCPLLLRMADYYADAEYKSAEVPRLRRELERLRLNPQTPRMAEELAGALARIAREAEVRNTGLIVLAD